MELGAESDSSVPQKLLALLFRPPGRFIRATVVPPGEVRLTTRSPTQEWSRPTVVEPTAVEQLSPSKLSSTLLTVPTPDTASGTWTPAGDPSGMAAAGPWNVKGTATVAGVPVWTVNSSTVGLVPRPAKVTDRLNFTFWPHATAEVSAKLYGVALLPVPPPEARAGLSEKSGPTMITPGVREDSFPRTLVASAPPLFTRATASNPLPPGFKAPLAIAWATSRNTAGLAPPFCRVFM